MSDNSSIEWTDATWNPVTGCSVVSPGCTNCYAMGLAGTRLRNHPSRAGLTIDTKAGPIWNGEVRLNEQWLTQPLKWKRPRTIFVCAHGDLFHENVPDEWIDRVFAVMALAPQHTFQVLTKRAKRMREYMVSGRRDAWSIAADPVGDFAPLSPQEYANRAHVRVSVPTKECFRWESVFSRFPLPNVWLGVSAEDQKRADERVPDLLATPAAVRFVSAEPLLGPINFEPLWGERAFYVGDAVSGFIDHEPCIDWIIVGGESGPNARPMHPDWARSIRDQCDAGAAFFYKQHGEWKALAPGDGDWPTDTPTMIRLRPDGTKGDDGWPMQRVGKKFAGRLLDGRTHDEMPTRSA